MSIRISVVIPTFKRPHLLKKCITALVHQRLDKSSYEIIVVSDGYDAATEAVVRNVNTQLPAISYHHLSMKKGPAAARNFGWKQAKGILVAFTDDDTLPEPEWLSSYLTAYNGEQLIAYTGSVRVPISRLPTDYEKNTAGLETAAFVTANCCCTVGALEKVHGFDERFSMAWREDSDLEFKLLKQSIPIRRINDAVIIHPVRKAPWGISLKEQKKGMYNALLYKKFPQLYRQKIQQSPLWNYYLIVVSFTLMVGSGVAGNKPVFFTFFLVWLFPMVQFVARRLRNTSRAAGHVFEMIVTSMVIPFLSVYWQLYGAFRYKVLFL